MDSEIVLFDKDGFKFSCLKKNNYSLTFTMENNEIVLSKIIDFKLIKLVYDLNSDVYEKVNMEILNNDEIILTLLMKHFFEDLGLPQRYSFIHMKKLHEEGKIKFISQSIKSHKPEGMPKDAELMALEKMIATCESITPHKIYFSFSIIFDDEMNVPFFAEKMVGMILHKIFKRVKQFIENVRL
jgi:serine phosphatase RsbU (regulator of sigma subunit)